MMKIRIISALAALASLFALSSPAFATLVTYTSSVGGFTYDTASTSPAFLAASGITITPTISFSGASNTDGTSYSSDVTFSTKTGIFGGSNTAQVNAQNEIGPFGSWDGILNIDFLANGNTVSAVGFGLVEFNSSVEFIRIYDDTNALIATFNNQLPDTFSFWGVVGNAGERIGRVELDGNFFAIQDISFTGQQISRSVPEPASLALLGIGLVGLGAMRRRKQMA